MRIATRPAAAFLLRSYFYRNSYACHSFFPSGFLSEVYKMAFYQLCFYTCQLKNLVRLRFISPHRSSNALLVPLIAIRVCHQLYTSF